MQFQKLTAQQELATQELVAQLLPSVLAKGTALPQALALAHNVVLLYFVLALTPSPKLPEELLALMSLEEIASLCEKYLDIEEGGCSQD